MKTNFFLIAFLIVIIFATASCVPGDGKHTAQKPAGFFWGMWHGCIAPVSLIIGIFDKKIRIYETNNKGWTYDLGFCISIICGFGGSALSRRRNNNKNC
ncbi:MAG: hypothetical protein A2086_00675 [Spirochaetes bacterium GWD1_27_9]|nr:MAG: hypothetical protein A2Z98_05185 [Spirochaetes bacterium GWB1_27_13]OHD21724.1 MAG: hypothetical protein A2Y34_08475 [Spirochaetes bacterium GWC1_27_15]OHD32524.1 MAG: hypothetical protein A2086_00675 [Spirochaetes bacterium GWD1_27_9]